MNDTETFDLRLRALESSLNSTPAPVLMKRLDTMEARLAQVRATAATAATPAGVATMLRSHLEAAVEPLIDSDIAIEKRVDASVGPASSAAEQARTVAAAQARTSADLLDAAARTNGR